MNRLSIEVKRLLVALFALTAVNAVRADPNLDPIPGYYQDPGISANRDYVNQGLGEHIDPFTGKLQFHFVDLFLGGNGGLNIKVQRSYSSGDGFLRDPGPVGIGWTMSFGRVIRKATVNICDTSQPPPLNPVLELPDGSRQIMYVGDGTVGTTGVKRSEVGTFVLVKL